jgi:hypothetical protein
MELIYWIYLVQKWYWELKSIVSRNHLTQQIPGRNLAVQNWDLRTGASNEWSPHGAKVHTCIPSVQKWDSRVGVYNERSPNDMTSFCMESPCKSEIRELKFMTSRTPMVRQVPTWSIAVQNRGLRPRVSSVWSPHGTTSCFMDCRSTKVRLSSWSF